MKQYFLLLGILLTVTANAQHFITRWVFPQPSNTITFNGVTEGEVLGDWYSTSYPSGGNFRFQNSNPNFPIHIAIPIPAGDTVTLRMEPSNLRRFFLSGGFNNGNFRELIEVRQWGNVPWESFESAFSSCPNLRLTATDVPNLSQVKSMREMFWFSRSVSPPFNIDLWDVRGVTNMQSMFAETSFNRDISAWKVHSLVNAEGMFSNSGISCESYSRMIKAWALDPNTPGNVNFSFQRSAFYANTADPFRNALIAKGWSISMDGRAIPGNSCYDMPLPVTFGNISAMVNNDDRLVVNWTTLSETNSDYFEVEASHNGTSFTSIGRVLSRAEEGRTSLQLNYEFTIGTGSKSLATCLVILLIGAGLGRRCRNKYLFPLILVAVCISIAGCAKSSISERSNDGTIYIRIKQIDKDNNFSYSKVVKAVRG